MTQAQVAGFSSDSPPAQTPTQRAPRFWAGGFWRRTAAFCLDSVVVLPLALCMAMLASALGGYSLPPSRHRSIDFWIDAILAREPAIIAGLVILCAVAGIYGFVFQATVSRTPGMRILGLKVIDVYGEPLTVVRAFARTISYTVSFLTLGLGFLWTTVSSERRALHDLLSGCHVVRS